jgi:DNA-binding response OmpR family regulator
MGYPSFDQIETPPEEEAHRAWTVNQNSHTDALSLLLVEDNEQMARALSRMLLLESPGWELDTVHDPDSGVARALTREHDLMLLDWDFGGKVTGLDVCRSVRAAGCTVPIIMLTVEEDVAMRVAALDAGADEFLVKGSVSALELCRRIKVAVVRARARAAAPAVAVQGGPVTIHTVDQTVFIDGNLIDLPRHERRIMMRLAEDPGQVVPMEALCVAAGIEPGHKNRNLQNTMWRMRERLGPRASKQIQNVRGKGYRLDASRIH